MKKLTYSILVALVAFVMASPSMAQDSTAVQPPAQHGPGFIDENGDGWNDRAPDADGDGIPNGFDPDYTGPKKGPRFVDADGDGVNDLAQDFDNDGIPNGQDPDYRRTQNRGQGKGFVDEDGDGKNDNRKAWGKHGRGRFGVGNPGQATGLQNGRPRGPQEGAGPQAGQGQGKGRQN